MNREHLSIQMFQDAMITKAFMCYATAKNIAFDEVVLQIRITETEVLPNVVAPLPLAPVDTRTPRLRDGTTITLLLAGSLWCPTPLPLQSSR